MNKTKNVKKEKDGKTKSKLLEKTRDRDRAQTIKKTRRKYKYKEFLASPKHVVMDPEHKNIKVGPNPLLQT